jgi:hypothetical protein
LNYRANFLWIGRCRGELATSLRIRGASLKAFAEVGLSSAVRAVLAKALDPGAAGLRAEIDPKGQQLQQLIASMSQPEAKRRKTDGSDNPLRQLLEDNAPITSFSVNAPVQMPQAPSTPHRNLHSHLPSLPLPEACLDWTKDFEVSRHEIRGVKSQFKTILSIEILAGQLPPKSPVEAWATAPPLRLRDLAQCSVSSYRSQLKRRYDTISAGDAERTIAGNRKRAHSQGSDDSDEDDDILKISEIMSTAGVWRAVWYSYRSDLSNQMLSLKCLETGANFSARRPETVRGHIQVVVHKYKKSTDWPLAWTALQNTRDLYEKRVREFLDDMFRTAGRPVDESGQLARDIAVTLRVAA